jgi:hypothetical protein
LRPSVLGRSLGAEWQEPLRLPPHDCLVPVHHHYHPARPRLRDHIADPVWAGAAADRTLFLVMPLYPSGSLRTCVGALRAAAPAPPHGKAWVAMGG